MRKIIHIDADAFYASVEMREDPSLHGKPVAVGGSPEGRGVVAAANYEARKFGVRSAMSAFRALQQCPKLVLIPPRFDLYRQVSRQFHEIFQEYTSIIEPLSLDEAYLDVSDSRHCNGSATLIAESIRQRVKDELSLTVSAGVAPNKFLAKVASDWNKPDGIFTVSPEEVDAFVEALPVSKIMGVGKVTAEKLRSMGVITCGDLQDIDLDTLVRRFGKYGPRLADMARGVDNRSVKTRRQRKSISVERTFARDLADEEAILQALDPLLEELARRFSRIETDYQPCKRFIKVKFRDFTQTTQEEVMLDHPSDWRDSNTFRRLLLSGWQRRGLPVRLLGAGLKLAPRQAPQGAEEQLALFSGSD